MSNFLNIELQYLIFCLSTLFAVINPLGITPIFVAMTEKYDSETRSKIARKGIITGSMILIVFTLLGSIIFQFYGITVEAFQIMGGVIFFRSGMRMLDAKVGRSRTTESEREEFKDTDEIAISPIGANIHLRGSAPRGPTSRKEDRMEKTLDILKTEAEISKLMAETMKLNAEASKLNREHRWLPVVYATGLIAASITFAKLFLN